MPSVRCVATNLKATAKWCKTLITQNIMKSKNFHNLSFCWVWWTGIIWQPQCTIFRNNCVSWEGFFRYYAMISPCRFSRLGGNPRLNCQIFSCFHLHASVFEPFVDVLCIASPVWKIVVSHKINLKGKVSRFHPNTNQCSLRNSTKLSLSQETKVESVANIYFFCFPDNIFDALFTRTRESLLELRLFLKVAFHSFTLTKINLWNTVFDQKQSSTRTMCC